MKKRFIFTILLFILIVNFIPYYAADDGEGKSEALTLVESMPADGSKDVILDTEIKLLFNKNVVNLTVKDNNAKCFSLLDSDNQKVSMDIVFADDQMEPDKKREIILKPKESLREGINYTVVISPELQAKNGTTMVNAITFTFTTLVKDKKEDIKAVEQGSAETAASTDKNVPAVTIAPSSETVAETVSDAAKENGEAVAVNESSTTINSDAAENNTTDASSRNAEANPMKSEEQSKTSTAFSTVYIWVIVIIAAAVVFIILGINAKKRKL